MADRLEGQSAIYRLCTEYLAALLEGRTEDLPQGPTPEQVIRLFLGLVKINEDGRQREEEITFNEG